MRSELGWQNTKDNPPCNTLFIGNLGEAVIETELRGLFCGCDCLVLVLFLCDLWSSLSS